ncbi:HVO_A0114 family putative DNA-binding protein [Acetobacter pasteurianus]|uniref:HVO_A0114 family putative DNA-binding protein n=1 Tax=Acetobacter pasteurianus TaxID=438 RepID=UPI0038D0DF3E
MINILHIQKKKGILLIGCHGLDEVGKRLAAAFEGKKQAPRHTFISLDLMWSTLTPRRQELLQMMAGREPMSIRNLGKLIERNVKTTHGDIQVLLPADLLEKVGDKVIFPYNGFHVDYRIERSSLNYQN